MNNHGFQYTYRTFNEIIEITSSIINFSTIEFIIFGINVFVTFILILYLMPIYKIFKSTIEKDIKKKRKRKSLEKMLLQKDIETEIEKELEKEKQERIKGL